MLQALEGLGLITRRVPEDGDRRQLEVSLTDKGLQCLREAYRMVVRWLLRFVFEVICPLSRDPDDQSEDMLALEGHLDALRFYCRDTARLYYPWGHPDD
jgi:DNA-binding MarR family transcriptional regulator